MTHGPNVDAVAPTDAWRHALRFAAASETLIAQLRARMGLSSNEMNVLLLLHDGGACTMTELSNRVRLTRPALTALVDRLEADGWIARGRDEGDRRRVIVEQTERFEAELVAGSHGWRQRLQNLASSDRGAWERLRSDIDQLCHIASRSALELRPTLAPVTHPGR
jgi:DNA-binding MarR family transcriptional regulator